MHAKFTLSLRLQPSLNLVFVALVYLKENHTLIEYAHDVKPLSLSDITLSPCRRGQSLAFISLFSSKPQATLIYFLSIGAHSEPPLIGITRQKPLASGSFHLTQCLCDCSTLQLGSVVHSFPQLVNTCCMDPPHFVHPFITLWPSEMLLDGRGSRWWPCMCGASSYLSV